MSEPSKTRGAMEEPPYDEARSTARRAFYEATESLLWAERDACAALFTKYLAALTTYRDKVDGLNRCWGKDAYDCRRELDDARRRLNDAARALNRIMGDHPVAMVESR